MTSRNAARLAAIFFACAAGTAAAALANGCFVGIDEGLLDASTSGTAGDASDAHTSAADGGIDAPYLGVPCGSDVCAPPIDVCCSKSFGDTDYRRGSCTTRDTCKTGDFMACTAASDCRYPGAAGAYCCVIRLSGGAYTQTACSDGCDGGTDASDVLCTEGDDTTCPPGLVCRASLEFPVLFGCIAP